MCGLRMLAAKNSRKRSEARSPAAAISAGTTCAAPVTCLAWRIVAGSWAVIGLASNAARRNAGHLVRLAELRRECVPIRAARAASDAMLMVAGFAGGVVPRSVIGHRPFDGEHAPVVVGDDEVEWGGRLGWFIIGHGK